MPIVILSPLTYNSYDLKYNNTTPLPPEYPGPELEPPAPPPPVFANPVDCS